MEKFKFELSDEAKKLLRRSTGKSATELIKVEINDGREPIVSGRELHEFLGVKTQYRDWFPRMVEYGFTEGVDFSSFLSESTGGRPAQDHAIKLDMAKELCMLQRTEKGKQARKNYGESASDC